MTVIHPETRRTLTAGFLRHYDLVSLRLLLSAIDEGNLAKVASRENVSASAVSRRISELEARIGLKLLRRHDRGVSPTEAATANLSRLRNLFDLIDQIVDDFEENRIGNRGVIRVRAHLTAIIGPLPGSIAAFASAAPGIDVIVDEANSSEIVHAVQVGSCDLGCISGTVDTGNLEVFPWRSDRLMAVMPKGHALDGKASIRFDDMLDHPFVGMAVGSSLLTMFRGQAAALGRGLDEIARVSTFEGVRELVGAGMGVSILPAAAITGEKAWRGLATRTLDEPWADRPLVICTRNREQLSVATRRFLDHLLSV